MNVEKKLCLMKKNILECSTFVEFENYFCDYEVENGKAIDDNNYGCI